MRNLFDGAYEFNQGLSKWDVSVVTDMAYMFYDAFAFNQDLSKWDVSIVTAMYGMFSSAKAFNGDVSKWDVSRVTDMCQMFDGCWSFNQDLSKWDVSRVTDMDLMFSTCYAFKRKLCGVAWVDSKATQEGMFYYSPGSIADTACTTAKRRQGLWSVICSVFIFFVTAALVECTCVWLG